MNPTLKTFLRFEAIVVTNVRYVCVSQTKTQLTTSYGKPAFNSKRQFNLPKNIILRQCSPNSSALLLDGMVASVPMTSVRRPLTLIFSWMLAKDKHLEKYRQLWFRRGFDVLTVRTSPLDLLLPPVGGRVVAKNLVKCLSELNSQYNEMVVHAFSVGGYQFGETLLQLRGQECDDVLNSIKGVVLDSMVFTEDAAPGLSRAITLNPILQPMIETSIHGFLKLFDKVSVKNYEKASQMIFNPLVKYPGLFFYSMDDMVSNVETNKKLAQNWRKLGNRVDSVCWEHSTHVLHYRDHQSEYEQRLDRFLKSLNLRNYQI